MNEREKLILLINWKKLWSVETFEKVDTSPLCIHFILNDNGGCRECWNEIYSNFREEYFYWSKTTLKNSESPCVNLYLNRLRLRDLHNQENFILFRNKKLELISSLIEPLEELRKRRRIKK